MNVSFDEERHQYTVDGVSVPSVTQLVAPLGMDYDEPDDLLEGVLDAAADRGSALHAYIAFRLSGGSGEDFELPDSYQQYVEGIELFLAEHEIIPILVEEPLPGSGYAGTPDLVCEFDGVPTIVDYKFVSSVAKTKVGAQLAGYMDLCEQNGLFPEKLYAVQFLKTGDYRLYPVGLESGREAFELCRKLHALKTKKHPRGRID